MRALIQRVSRAEVRVDGTPVGRIDAGILVLLGVVSGDGAERAGRMAERCARLRIFSDEHGRMNRSLHDTGGAALVVSQFTLAADCRKGRRPSFDAAAPAEAARRLYDAFVGALAEAGVRVETGRFGASMEVELVGDGPVTILLEEPERGPL